MEGGEALGGRALPFQGLGWACTWPPAGSRLRATSLGLRGRERNYCKWERQVSLVGWGSGLRRHVSADDSNRPDGFHQPGPHLSRQLRLPPESPALSSGYRVASMGRIPCVHLVIWVMVVLGGCLMPYPLPGPPQRAASRGPVSARAIGLVTWAPVCQAWARAQGHAHAGAPVS